MLLLGAVVACWQLISGTEPQNLREALQQALPRSPPSGQQVVKSPIILHSTLARLATPAIQNHQNLAQQQTWDKPTLGSEWQVEHKIPDAVTLKSAVAFISEELCGLKLTLDHAWLVHEKQLLALALNGGFEKVPVPFLCKHPVI